MSRLIVNEIEKYDASQLTISSPITVTGGITGTLSTAAQTNITSVGTLSSLAVSGLASIGGTGVANYPLTLRSKSGDFTKILDWGTDIGGSWGNITINTSSPYETILNSGSWQFNTSGTEKMRIDSSGRVGIGISPTEKLEVNGNLRVSSDSGTTFTTIVDTSTGGKQWTLVSAGAGNVHSVAAGSFYLRNSSDGRNTIVVDSSGNVGIGVSPDTDLTVKGKSGAAGVVKVVGNSSSHRGEFLAEGAGQFTGSFVSVPSGAATYNGIPASSVGITTSSTNLVIATSNTERMRITSGGYLKASNDGTYSGSTATYHEFRSNQNGGMLDVRNTSGNPNLMYMAFPNASPNNTTNYFLYAEDSTELKVVVYSNGNIVNRNNSYGAISDAKLKENVTDASPKLEDLMQVKVRNFNYIGDEKKQLGVVAQELEEVFPSMIDESTDFEERQVEVRDEEGNIVYKTEQVLVSEAVEAVYEEVVHPAEEAVYEEVIHPAEDALYDAEGNVVVPAKEEWIESVLVSEAKEEWIEQVLVTPAIEAVYETITLDEPEMTTERFDLGTVTKSVKYSVFVPMLIKAIQEQQEIIDGLKARIEALESLS
jgi:hypothetical protein